MKALDHIRKLIVSLCISCAWVLAWVAVPAHAQTHSPSQLPPIVIQDAGNVDLDIGLHAAFFVEDGAELSLSEAQSSEIWQAVSLALIEGSRANPTAASTAPYAIGLPTWVHFRVHNTEDIQQNFVIDTHRPDLRNVSLYQVSASGQSKLLLEHSGFESFQKRQIKQNDLAANVSIPPEEISDFYLRYVRTASEPMPLKLYGVNAYSEKTRLKAAWLSAFFTMLATIIVITLLGLPALGWRIALSYVFYVAMVGFWYAGVTGLFFSVLTPNAAGFGGRATEAFAVLVFAAFLNMGRVLFKYEDNRPRYYVVLLIVIWLNIIVAGITFLVDIYSSPPLAHTVSILTLVSCILYVSNSIIAVRDKRSGAFAMLFGSLSLLVAFGIYRYVTVAVNEGLIVVPIGRLILVPPIAIIEICCFALAMIMGQISIRRQRDQALQSEFTAMQEKLRLSEALNASEKSFQKAQKKAQLRKQRLTLVSHDILQPITSLKASLEDMGDFNSSKLNNMKEAFNYLEKLARESLTGGAPRDDTEDHSGPALETFEIRVIADNVYAMFKGEAQLKNLKFTYHLNSNFDVTSNPVELMRVISNLISNAIKYTESGQVSLTTQDEGEIQKIIVTDTGPGMCRDEIEKFIERNGKGDKSGGEGLGLYQAIRACDKLGHNLEIYSLPGEGTKISVIFNSYNNL